MSGTENAILEHSERLPQGAVLAPKAFLHLASRAAVDQALSRLSRRGHLLRVARGRYVKPARTRFGVSMPAPGALVEQLGRVTGETIVSSGASAANVLGLTTQMPVRAVFLTSGRSRQLEVGRQTVELRHAPSWQLWGRGTMAGNALRALAWLGPEHVPAAAPKAMRQLAQGEREALLAASGVVPGWLSKALAEAFVAETEAAARPAHV